MVISLLFFAGWMGRVLRAESRPQKIACARALSFFKHHQLTDIAAVGPGLHFVLCPLKSIVGRLSLRIQQLDVLCETKTKGAFVDSAGFFFIVAFTVIAMQIMYLPFESLGAVLFLFLDNVFVQVRFPLMLWNKCCWRTIMLQVPLNTFRSSHLHRLLFFIGCRRCPVPRPRRRSIRCLLSIDGTPRTGTNNEGIQKSLPQSFLLTTQSPYSILHFVFVFHALLSRHHQTFIDSILRLWCSA